MTTKELKEEAKKLNLVGYSNLKKEELERLISISKLEVIEMSKEEFKSSINNIGVEILEYSDEDDWEELRRKRIGGSDIGAIVGVNPHKSIVDVYIDKIQGSEFKGNDATFWGKMNEPTVVRVFSKKHSELITYQVPYSVVEDFLIANLDGVLKDKETGEYGVLEIKTTEVWNSKNWEDDEIPQSYYAQVQHYLMLTGYKFAYVAVLIGSHKYREFRVERSEEDIEFIKNRATEFYKENILKEIPPMPDGSDAYMEYLKKKAAEIENNELIELADLEIKAEELNHISKQINELKKEEQLLKEIILDRMIKENTQKAKIGNHKFNIQNSPNPSLNKEKFKKEDPEFFEEYNNFMDKAKTKLAPYQEHKKFIRAYFGK
ncbi:lambda-exonuclease family protein [Fusobacterium sp.]|uniref:YqaJ viral recombinase family nuclease n=1 Tax=Fusobacterium sp. TaxID=68766 RepID=UPI0025BC5AB1|nr:YqaJ viral recombinase family protein [Fusobacterium sp.]MCI7223296.1 YqaJ viral recombinase family protein [Fusobacterium sp.]